MVVNFPREDESMNNLKRVEIVANVILPAGHGFLTHLRAHIEGFEKYRRMGKIMMSNLNKQ